MKKVRVFKVLFRGSRTGAHGDRLCAVDGKFVGRTLARDRDGGAVGKGIFRRSNDQAAVLDHDVPEGGGFRKDSGYVGRLVGWLIGWLAGWLANRLVVHSVSHGRHHTYEQLSSRSPTSLLNSRFPWIVSR